MRLRRHHSYPGMCPAGKAMQAAQALPEAPIGFSNVHAAACRQERPSQATLPDSSTRRQPACTVQHAQPGPGTQPHARPVAEHKSPNRIHAASHDQEPGSASSENDFQLAPELLADQAAEAAGEADLEVMHSATEQGTEAEMQEIYESALEAYFGGSQAPYTAAGRLHATIHVAAQAHLTLQQQGSQAPDTAAAAHADGQACLRLQVPPTASQPQWAQPGIGLAATAPGKRQARWAEPEGHSPGRAPPTDSQPQWAQPGICTVAAAAGDTWQAEPEAKSPGQLDLQSDRDMSSGKQAATDRQARDWMDQACQVAQQGRAQLQGAPRRRHTPAGTLQQTVPDSPTVMLSPMLGNSLASGEHLSDAEGCHHRLEQQKQPALVSATPSPAGLVEPPPPPAEWLNMEEDSRNGGSISVTPEHIAFQLGQQPDTAPAQVSQDCVG